MHCDPCEDSIDQPLLYLHGWKREVNLCLSLSIAEGVRDVTWRYNNRHEALKEARRAILVESWLRELIRLSQPTNVIQGWERGQQQRDWIDEAVEFLNPPIKIDASNLKERKSGSAQWRVSRGETTTAKMEAIAVPMKVEKGVFELKYCCSSDKYTVNGVDSGNWATFAHNSSNFFRKEETDWQMVYLARWVSVIVITDWLVVQQR